MEMEKLNEDEFERLREMQTTWNKLSAELGGVEINRVLLNHKYDSLKESIIELNRQENIFKTHLNEKYGDFSLDLNTGIIKRDIN
jgi:hypothetical protein